jgi:myo-inositol catabolism protein IolC
MTMKACLIGIYSTFKPEHVSLDPIRQYYSWSILHATMQNRDPAARGFILYHFGVQTMRVRGMG